MDKVTHFEIPADDEDRAQRFYETVFGWKIFKAPIPNWDYRLITTVETNEKGMPASPGAINGGLMKRKEAGQQPVIVISVTDLEGALQKSVAAGAAVVMQARPVGELGTYARIKDTEGNVIGLWQNLKGA